MRKIAKSFLMVFAAFAFVSIAGKSNASAQDVSVSYQTFYDELSPYGQWVYDPDYGNVWIPNESSDFRPYSSRGRWAMTEYGNTWVSDDPWGWACYHYGRWTYNPYYGWIWVPGYEWAPAWVSWRYGGGYCGWAPLSPGFSIGTSYGCPDSWWVFVGPTYLYSPNPYSYWRGQSYNRTYIRQTTVINNVYMDNRTHVQYYYGPSGATIQQVTHKPVQVYRISQTTRPGGSAIQQTTINMYRPVVNAGSAGSARPSNVIQAPKNIGRPQAATATGTSRQTPFRQEIQRQNPGAPGNTGVAGPRRNGADNSQLGNSTTRGNGATAPAQRNDNRNIPQTRPQQGRFTPANQSGVPQQPTQRNAAPAQQNGPAPQQQSRPEPQRYNAPAQQPQQQTRPEPQRYNPPAQQPQQQTRPEPQRYNPPAQQPQQQTRPEPQRYNPPAQQPQQQTRPEPQRYNPPAQQPQQQTRPEPQRYNPPAQQPQQQSRPEPQRYNPPAQQPQQQTRPEPQRYNPPAQQPQQQQSRPQQQAPQQQAPQRSAPAQGEGRRGR